MDGLDKHLGSGDTHIALPHGLGPLGKDRCFLIYSKKVVEEVAYSYKIAKAVSKKASLTDP